MVTLASSNINVTAHANGWVTPTAGQVMTFPITTPGTSGWTLGAWADYTDQGYVSYAMAASIGSAAGIRNSTSLDQGAVGMGTNPPGRAYARPLNTTAARVPTYVMDQGPLHLAIRYEHISGSDYMVTFFINGVPMFRQSDTITTLDATVLQFGQTTLSGAIKTPDRFANTFYTPTALTDAQISSRYLSENAALGISQKKLLVIGSFDSLTAFNKAPFWGSTRDASLRPGVHFMLDAMGGSKHGGGSDFAGSGSNYNSPERQGLRRDVLVAAAAHYDKVIWLCQYGTNDLVSGEMTPGTGAWTTGRDTIDEMIFGDIDSVPLANRSRVQATLVTIPPHGQWIEPGAIAIEQDREVARQEYNQDCRDNYASRGYGAVLDWATHTPAGFANLEAAAIDAIANAGNDIYQGDGIHWEQTGSDAAAADLITPYLATELAALTAGSAPELTAVYEPTASNTTVGMPLQFNGDLDVDWGDGTTETLTGSGWKEHTYASAGTYTATFDGAITRIWHSVTPTGQLDHLTSITSWGNQPLVQIWLRHAVRLASVPSTLPSTVTTLNECFKECHVFDSPNVLTWDTGNVTDFTEIFKECLAFNQPVGSWDTSSCTNMQRAFGNCTVFNQSLEGWDTSLVTDMADMFNAAPVFNGACGSWNTGAVTGMANMFLNAVTFNQDISGWDVSNVSNMTSMFSNAEAFNQNIGGWNTASLTEMGSMFLATETFNQDISGWDISGVTSLSKVFLNAKAFNSPLNTWNTTGVTNMSSMFLGASVFNQSLADWDVSAVTDMSDMFSSASIFNGALTNWNTAALTDCSAMFRNADAFNQPINHLNISGCTSMSRFLNGADAFNQPMDALDVSSVSNMDNMVYSASSFDQDLSGWCVSLILAEPTGFAINCPIITPNKPVWGTCPSP